MVFGLIGLAIIAGVLALAAGTVGTIAAYQQGRAQEAMYKAEAEMAYKQSAAAKEAAQRETELVQDQASAESKRLRRQQLKFMASQKANLAAMGIEGVTTEDIIADTTLIQNMDKATLRWNADTAAWEAKTQGDYSAWQFQGQAAMARAAASNTHRQTNLGLVKNILGTASSTVGAFTGVMSMGGGAAGAGASATPSSGGAGTMMTSGAGAGGTRIGGHISGGSGGFRNTGYISGGSRTRMGYNVVRFK